jgi:hypothetical protein
MRSLVSPEHAGPQTLFVDMRSLWREFFVMCIQILGERASDCLNTYGSKGFVSAAAA